ncbi:hypothetical protein ScPMuIL_007992 [Solemya velum]
MVSSLRINSAVIIFLFELLLLHRGIAAEDNIVDYHERKGQTCTYFEEERFAAPEVGLVNCSWYVQKSCCKRTEVTSVFSSMLPLFGATEACKNRMNYLMCYFCSPEQHRWYKGKVHVCHEFCASVYQNCKDASHDGLRIGETYQNGSSFCEAQNFEVVEGTSCFKFDPTVFGGTESTNYISFLLLLPITVCVLMASR